jgi:hypothetical protein
MSDKLQFVGTLVNTLPFSSVLNGVRKDLVREGLDQE